MKLQQKKTNSYFRNEKHFAREKISSSLLFTTKKKKERLNRPKKKQKNVTYEMIL